MKCDIDYLIMFNMAGIGYVRLKKLIDHFGDAESVLKVSKRHLEKAKGIGPSLAQKISEIEKDDLKREWALIKKHKVTLLSIFDENYPERLKNIYDPPIVLYVKGEILPQDSTAIALVGSRKASLYGLNMCEGLAGRLAGLGVTIISGLARGIDSAAHKGALKSSGRTLAVLGNGLCTIYPPENTKLAEEILKSGVLLSEFPMEKPPLAQNFPIRNRIISALSLGVVIVEAAHKSGALITAECALEQGRDVFAVPGRANSITSTGTHRLIRNGAKLVESVDDIIEELNLDLVPFVRPAIDVLPNGTRSERLNGDEKTIYNILSDEPEHIDNVINKANLPPQEVIRLLLMLEVKKLIKQLPGKNFVTI